MLNNKIDADNIQLNIFITFFIINLNILKILKIISMIYLIKLLKITKILL